MAPEGVMPARALMKSMVPEPVRAGLKKARRRLRDTVRAASRRLTRPNLYRLDTPERVGVAFTAPSDMLLDERLFLYAFVRGFRPQKALEIGVLRGGSAAVIANAMQENGIGMLAGIDPEPDMKVKWADLHGRYTLVRECSPQGIPAAVEAVGGGPLDFVLIDGLHMYDQVVKDIAGVLPHLADGAYVLFHDAFHYGVATAIREAVEANASLVDCGYPCRTANHWADPAMPYNGFRLLRYAAAAGERSVDVERVLEPLYAAEGKPRPPLTREVLNHDLWYCRCVKPCPRCEAAARAAK